jgi:hypothetical protein
MAENTLDSNEVKLPFSESSIKRLEKEKLINNLIEFLTSRKN